MSEHAALTGVDTGRAIAFGQIRHSERPQEAKNLGCSWRISEILRRSQTTLALQNDKCVCPARASLNLDNHLGMMYNRWLQKGDPDGAKKYR
jgi:hypothetical protein